MTQPSLSRAQRHYLEGWVHTLASLRPERTDAELRLADPGAVGAIHSTLFFRSGLEPERLASLLDAMAARLPRGRDDGGRHR